MRAGAVLVVRGRFLIAGVNDYLVSDGFLHSLSMCKRGFHDLLTDRPSSLLMLCGRFSSSIRQYGKFITVLPCGLLADNYTF